MPHGDARELFAFIEETNRVQSEMLVKAHGGDDATARQRFLQRLGREIKDALCTV
jgi:hypothetical protein